MFEKILYPTDFSDVAVKALDYIKQLREAGSQEVVILHVINQRTIDGLMRHSISEDNIEAWRKKAKEVAQESLTEIKEELDEIEESGFKQDLEEAKSEEEVEEAI